MYNPHENRPKVDKTGENKAGIITRFEQFCTVLSGMFRTETPVNPLWSWTFLTETGINVGRRECCRFAPFYPFIWVLGLFMSLSSSVFHRYFLLFSDIPELKPR